MLADFIDSLSIQHAPKLGVLYARSVVILTFLAILGEESECSAGDLGDDDRSVVDLAFRRLVFQPYVLILWFHVACPHLAQHHTRQPHAQFSILLCQN